MSIFNKKQVNVKQHIHFAILFNVILLVLKIFSNYYLIRNILITSEWTNPGTIYYKVYLTFIIHSLCKRKL